MKAIIISFALFVAVFMSPVEENIHNNSTEYKTFLVETNLTKEELHTLLEQGETEVTNLKKKNLTYRNIVIIHEINGTNLTEGTLQQRIEQEIKADALNPLHEFVVKKEEIKTLVTKSNKRFIDSLYEKKFGKFYGYLTLFLFIFVMIYYKDIIFNQKSMNIKKPYINNSDFLNEKEYMLVKNN